MAYIYKKLMRAEKYNFWYVKNRFNSRESFILADREGQFEERWVGTVFNKTGIFTASAGADLFKPKTIEKLKKIIV